MRIYPPNFNLEIRSFQEAWEKAVQFCMKEGLIIKPEENTKQLTRDMCSMITLYGNGIKDIFEQKLHPKFPTKEMHCVQYVKEYTREWIAEQNKRPEIEQFVYNYMDRLINYPCWNEPGWKLDQIGKLKKLVETGISRRHQIITWIPEKDLYSASPPCLQRIWIRKLNDEDCEIHFDWRSRDLYGAWMPNYIGLFDMLKREIFTPLDLTVVKVVDKCDSLHIYEGDWISALKV
jgi:thymidylate synthase